MIHNIHGPLFACGLLLVAAILLTGCTTTVLGHCPIPEALDYHANGPADPVAKNLKQHFVEDGIERHASKMLADDYNSLTAHIKDNCQ